MSLADMKSCELGDHALVSMEVMALVTLPSKQEVWLVGIADDSLVSEGDPSLVGIAKDPYQLMSAFLINLRSRC